MIENLYSKYLKSSGISTDTRTIQKGNIWFALKGPNFNANKFAEQALDKGALLAVIDDPEYQLGQNTLVVKDGLRALQQLANYHRNQLKIPFLGITGSNGKTTTKELVRDVLSTKYKVHATKGNFNNHIGVPLTILQIDHDIEFAVIEMGANAQEEIKQLCEIAEPDFGLITNIGKAHLEGFGGIEGVFKGKTEMYDFLSQKHGKVFVNTNDKRLVEKIDQLGLESYSYPNTGDYIELTLLRECPELLIDYSNVTFQTKITGAYNFENICSALCVGRYFKVGKADAIQAVAAYDPDNNRSQVIKKKSNTIIMDAYNANPSSVAEALKSFEQREADNKVVILGDMLELGAESGQEHFSIGELSQKMNFDQIHFCGPLMFDAYKGNDKALYWENKESLVTYLETHPIYDSTILVKGSRGMSLESLLNIL